MRVGSGALELEGESRGGGRVDYCISRRIEVRVRKAASTYARLRCDTPLPPGSLFPFREYAQARGEPTPSREPQAPSPKPRAPSREPQAASAKPRAPSRERQAASAKPRAPSRERQAASAKPRAPSREPQAASPKPRAPSREPQAPSPLSAPRPSQPRQQPVQPPHQPLALTIPLHLDHSRHHPDLHRRRHLEHLTPRNPEHPRSIRRARSRRTKRHVLGRWGGGRAIGTRPRPRRGSLAPFGMTACFGFASSTRAERPGPRRRRRQGPRRRRRQVQRRVDVTSCARRRRHALT